jgi:hypothetical protein
MTIGEWTHWETWSNCSRICSQGTQTRKRRCVKHAFTKECHGNATEARKCDDTNCCKYWLLGFSPT